MWMFLFLLLSTCSLSRGQVINRAPHFVQGGDMARLAVSEGTPSGAPVYTLQGEDPEGSRLHYSISGEYFTVNRETGVVVLRKTLDRETQDLIEVIISITGNSHRSVISSAISFATLLRYFTRSCVTNRVRDSPKEIIE